MQFPPSDAPRVSIIIPALCNFGLLLACLRSLQRNVPGEIPCEIIVVLNEAEKHAEANLAKEISGITILSSAVNLGLAGAGNRGRAQASGEFLVVLHDDAEVQPGWLEALIEAVESHPEAGAIGGKVLWPDGRLQDTGSILWRDANGSRLWVGAAPDPGRFDRICCVDYCGTSSLLIRASVWDAMGGLDERFFPAYFVDTDIGMSVRRLGGVVLYQPKSCIVHHRSASTTPHFRSFLFTRNQQRFREKWARELEGHEPATGEPEDALARAMARAEARRASASPTWPASAEPPTSPHTSVVEDAVWLKRSHDLQQDYIAYLDSLLLSKSIPTYTLGTRLTFDNRGEGNRHVIHGSLYEPEPCGSWIGTEPCRLFLPLVEDECKSLSQDKTMLTIEIEASHLIAAGREESPMRVTVGGTEIVNLIERRNAPQIYAASIPQSAWSSNGYLYIRIESANAVSPAELQTGSDERRLSIALISLTVHRAA